MAKRHLLVDGANVIQAWRDLRAIAMRDRDAARSQLVQRLAALHDTGDLRVTVVFDGRGAELVAEHPSGQGSFAVVFTPTSLTADDVIEQLAARAAVPEDCVVATDDLAQRQTVVAAGANAIGTAELAVWVARAEGRQRTKVEALRAANAREWRRG